MYIIPRDETGQTVWLLELCSMNTQKNEASVRQFSEKDKNYFAYQARQNYLRQQMSVYGELDETRQAKNNALHQLDLVSAERDALAMREQQALAERDAATAEIEKLKALLADRQS